MFASDLAKIPTSDFDWYVIFFEEQDPKKNSALKALLRDNFLSLGKEVGRDVLVVRGHDPAEFYRSAFRETKTLYDAEWNSRITSPALLITDTAPKLLWDEPAKLRAAKIISIPLAPFQQDTKVIAELLQRLLAALRDENAVSALRDLAAFVPSKRDEIENKWGWLRVYRAFLFGFNSIADAWIAG
jgi:hypothetical protein